MKTQLAEIQETITQIWTMLGGGEPKPTSLIELNARAPEKISEIGKKRKFDMQGWDDRSIKAFRAFNHPDKDILYCDGLNEIRIDNRTEYDEQTRFQCSGVTRFYHSWPSRGQAVQRISV